MLKQALLYSALFVATPVLAQDLPQTKADDGAPQTAAYQVAAIVKREFSAYDGDRSGVLDKAEFAGWMTALKAGSRDGAPSAPWTAAAFKQADADGSGTVSREELAAFFNGTKPAGAAG